MHHANDLEEAQDLSQWLAKQTNLRAHVCFKTSGTTASAKWVALSKQALLESARRVNQHLNVQVGACWGLALPIYHVGGFGILARAFLNDGNVHVYRGKWNAEGFTHFVEAHNCQYLSLVPTQIADLVQMRCACPQHIQAIIVGGGNLQNSLWQQAQELGWPIVRSYGMTEAASQIATGDTKNNFLKVLEGWNLRVNGGGLLEWKGNAAFSGYITKHADSYAFTDPKKDGWFTTQDRVELQQGALKMLGRADRFVKILGELVDLSSLESKIEHYTGVSCVLYTKPEKRRGVRLIAVLETEETLCLDHLHGLETVDKVITHKTFPRTSLGKIQRARLLESLNLVD